MFKGVQNNFRQHSVKRTSLRLSFCFLILISCLALFASFLCNEKPIYVKYNGVNLFPAFSWKGFADIPENGNRETERLIYSTTNWRELQKEKVIWCPVPYSPGKSDWLNAGYKSPFEKQYYVKNGNQSPAGLQGRHWLGTTETGSDVLSGLIHGTRISLSIGIFSMIIAGSIGIILGAVSGFFGDHRIIVSGAGLFAAVILGLPLSWFYGIHLNPFSFQQADHSILVVPLMCLFIIAAGAACIAVTYMSGRYIARTVNRRGNVYLPIDQLISRCIEIFNSIPRIILIITISAIFRPSVVNLILIIGLTSWTEIARLVRAEMLRVRESDFILSAEASGIRTARQVFRHALPNVVIPALTAITLGVASAILIESSLSFLGIGVPSDVVTWGSLLNEGRQNFNAWWLVAFPGIAIFTTVTAIHILGDALNASISARN
jgi:peptide/nickel transport system permease protein